jgi:hypothetical protein
MKWLKMTLIYSYSTNYQLRIFFASLSASFQVLSLAFCSILHLAQSILPGLFTCLTKKATPLRRF